MRERTDKTNTTISLFEPNGKAMKIGDRFATINRWENGRSEPTRLAQEGLYALCNDLNVPVYDVIIEKIKENFSKEVLFWIGYVYRYRHFYTKEESCKIYKQAPFETMSVNYLSSTLWTLK